MKSSLVRHLLWGEADATEGGESDGADTVKADTAPNEQAVATTKSDNFIIELVPVLVFP